LFSGKIFQTQRTFFAAKEMEFFFFVFRPELSGAFLTGSEIKKKSKKMIQKRKKQKPKSKLFD
jgi:hypothetical protein